MFRPANLIPSLTLLVLASASFDPVLAVLEEPATVEFKSGGGLDGQLISDVHDGKARFVVLETKHGGLLKLDKGKMIKRVSRSNLDVAQYRAMINKIDDGENSTELHGKIYDWCREKRLKAEALFHLRQIVKIDPSDEKAWRSFKVVDPDQAFVKINGQWLPEQQHYLNSGYTRVGGDWVSNLQTETNDHADARDQQESDNKVQLKKWKKYVLPREDPRDIRTKLFDLVNPSTIGYLENNYLRREKNPRIRSLYLEAIGQVATPAAQGILVRYLMTDRDEEVREQAMVMLEQESQFDPNSTGLLLTRYLRSNDNSVVNRAGQLIGRLKSTAALIGLMNALETTHVVATGNDPERLSTTFGTNGNTGLTMGGSPTQQIPMKNEGVLDALESITSQRSFGFDQDRWRQWYLSEHSTSRNDIRRSADN